MSNASVPPLVRMVQCLYQIVFDQQLQQQENVRCVKCGVFRKTTWTRWSSSWCPGCLYEDLVAKVSPCSRCKSHFLKTELLQDGPCILCDTCYPMYTPCTFCQHMYETTSERMLPKYCPICFERFIRRKDESYVENQSILRTH